VSGIAVGITKTQSLSRGTLAYRAAFTSQYLLSVELGTRFSLLIRKRPSDSKEIRPMVTVDLGTPDYDILALAPSGDGSRAFVGSSAGWVRTYRIPEGDLLAEWHMGSSVTSLAPSDDGASLLIGTASGVMCLRRLSDAAQLQCVVAHTDRVSALATQGSIAASASWDGAIALWSLPTLRAIARREGSGFISDLEFSDDGTVLAAARNARKPVRTPALNQREKKTPRVDPIGRNRIELHSTPRRLADTPQLIEGHRSVITSLRWLGPSLLSTSWDRTVQLWNTKTRAPARTLLQLAHLGSEIATSPRGGEIVIASWATQENQSSLTWARLLFADPPQPPSQDW